MGLTAILAPVSGSGSLHPKIEALLASFKLKQFSGHEIPKATELTEKLLRNHVDIPKVDWQNRYGLVQTCMKSIRNR